MSILSLLHPRFTLVAREAAASDQEIAKLIAFADAIGLHLPEAYLGLLKEATEIHLSSPNTRAIHLWGPDRTIEKNETSGFQRYLPQALAIGDDQDRAAYVLMTGYDGPGFYLSRLVAPDMSEATLIAPSLADFLKDGVGLDR